MASALSLADLLAAGGPYAGQRGVYGPVPTGFRPDDLEDLLAAHYPPPRRPVMSRHVHPYAQPAFGYTLDPYAGPYPYSAPSAHPWATATRSTPAPRARPQVQHPEFAYDYFIPRPAEHYATVDPLFQQEPGSDQDAYDASAEALAAALGALRDKQVQRQQPQVQLQEQQQQELQELQLRELQRHLEQQQRLKQQQLLKQQLMQAQQRRLKQLQQQSQALPGQAGKAPVRYIMVPAAVQSDADAGDAAPQFVLYPAAFSSKDDETVAAVPQAPAAHNKAPTVVYVPVAVPSHQPQQPATASPAATPAAASPLLPTLPPRESSTTTQTAPAAGGAKPVRVVKVNAAPNGGTNLESLVARLQQQQQQQRAVPVSIGTSPSQSRSDAASPRPAARSTTPTTAPRQCQQPARQLSRDEAATAIQTFWRGWRLWRHRNTVRALVRASKQLAAARATLEGYVQDARVGGSAGVISGKQQLEVSELAMRVLLNMDGLPAMPQALRAIRKALSADALKLQDQAQEATKPVQPAQPQATDKEKTEQRQPITEQQQLEFHPDAPHSTGAAAASAGQHEKASAEDPVTEQLELGWQQQQQDEAPAPDAAVIAASVVAVAAEQQVAEDAPVAPPSSPLLVAEHAPLPLVLAEKPLLQSDAARADATANATDSPAEPAAPSNNFTHQPAEPTDLSEPAAPATPAETTITLRVGAAGDNDASAPVPVSSSDDGTCGGETTGVSSGDDTIVSAAGSEEDWTMLSNGGSVSGSDHAELPAGSAPDLEPMPATQPQPMRAARMKTKGQRRAAGSRRVATVSSSPRRAAAKTAKRAATKAAKPSKAPHVEPVVNSNSASDSDLLRALGVTEDDGLVTMPAAVLKSLLRSLLADGGAGKQ